MRFKPTKHLILESTQHYNDGSPYLNPPDHPYECQFDDEEDEDEEL